jgi:2-methylisocitrate lyase-like PEP mutase family enzyme
MASNQSDKAHTFAELHQRPRPFVIPNPWDLGTARVLAGLGFEALATTSAGMAFALGLRDGAVTRQQAIDHACSIVEATPLPVSADLENGFGHAPQVVAETIRMAAAAGLAGASIEDASGDPERPIYELGQATERIAAAVEVARLLPFPFTLTARAENFLHGRTDLDDTIERLRAYEAAGANVLYAPGLRDIDQIRRVCQAVNRPVNVLMGFAGVSLTLAELAEAGVRRISLGSALTRVAVGAVLKAAREIQELGSFTFADDAVATKDLNGFLSERKPDGA